MTPHLQKRIVIIYAYFEKNSDYANNLRFFLQTAIRNHLDYIFVVNGKCTVQLPEQGDNIRVIHRDNVGYDFGAYAAGIAALGDHINDYQYHMFINTSVRGPFVPPYATEVVHDWTRPFVDLIQQDVKLAGCSINITNMEGIDASLRAQGYAPPYPHVQSMVFVLAREALQFLVHTEFFDRPPATTYDDAVCYYEIPLSCRILAQGWNIDCLIPEYHGRNYRKLQRNDMQPPLMGDPTWSGQCVGRTIHPYEAIFIKTNRGTSQPEINTLSAVMVSTVEEHFASSPPATNRIARTPGFRILRDVMIVVSGILLLVACLARATRTSRRR